MPQSTLSRSRVLAMLAKPPSDAALAELLFRSKAELKGGQGDEMPVEVTPDRLDLLSEGGLGLYLQGTTESAVGLLHPPGISRFDPPPGVRVDPSVSPLRPFLSALVVRAPTWAGVDAGLLAEAVRFQELLHATVGLGRRLASFGLYPYDRLLPPFTYAMEEVGRVDLVPLDGAGAMPAAQFLSDHPMAARYGSMGAKDGRLLTLRDRQGALLSLPPILNARPAGEVKVGDRTLLIESTGTRAARVADGLALLSLVFLARGWSVAPVPVHYPDRVDPGRALVDPRKVELLAETLGRLSGHAYPSEEVERLFGTVRLEAKPTANGWSVEVPPWRPDILGEVDLAEEIILADGVRAEDAILPPSRSLGRRRPESSFRRRVAALLIGAGFTELYTPVLIGSAAADRMGRTGAIALANPVSAEYSRLRDSLSPGLIAALEHNVRSPYPQRFFEVGPVVERDEKADTGASTRYHAGIVLASETAGFADAAGLADYVVGGFGGDGVREPASLPGMVPGRGARLRLAGETVAEMGEVAPSVLADARVPVPVAWVEVDLARLWPLVMRAPTVL
jgi:phenylalanyl-tRNA synthetase beta chain